MRLRTRLISTYLGVVAVVTSVSFLAIRWLTPQLAERGMQAGFGSARGQGGPAEISHDVSEAFTQALTNSLLIGGLVGGALAIVLALWVTSRILRRVSDVQDVTRRLAAGDYMQKVEMFSEPELHDLAVSINKLGSDLAATEQARARLVSDLAHEIRNPLATIESHMEALIDGVLPASPETYATISREAHRLQRLTEDLSLLSRAQEGALGLSLNAVDLGKIAVDVAERLRPQYLAKGVGLDLIVEGEFPTMADADRIGQALTNVIGNALTHTPVDGTVKIRCDRSGGRNVVRVSDDGEGISPDQLELIFQRFVGTSTSGSGIGLSIARAIARAHGGELVAYSAGFGQGSTFTLSIPAQVAHH